jgi:hypothetical protein
MASISEIDAMKLIDETLSQIEDSLSRDRILQWAWSKFSSLPTPISSTSKKMETEKPKEKGRAKKSTKTKPSYSIVKDLNLKPSDKQTLAQFISEKKPSSNREKSVVFVYYLQNILEETPITSNHIYTCFKSIGSRVPSNLDNTLSWVASQRGWLNTSSMANIKVTPHGENLIEHDLPKKKKGK